MRQAGSGFTRCGRASTNEAALGSGGHRGEVLPPGGHHATEDALEFDRRLGRRHHTQVGHGSGGLPQMAGEVAVRHDRAAAREGFEHGDSPRGVHQHVGGGEQLAHLAR